MSLSIIIVDKTGTLKTLKVKNFCEDDLYKRCGFKKDTNFSLRHKMSLTLNDKQHYFSFYGKSDGKNNFENQYPFLAFLKIKIYGNCAIVCYDENMTPTHLTVEQWDSICEQLKLGSNNLVMERNVIPTNKYNSSTSDKSSQPDNLFSETEIIELVEDEYNYSSDEENVR